MQAKLILSFTPVKYIHYQKHIRTQIYGVLIVIVRDEERRSNNINIIALMLQKTEGDDNDKQTISTKMPMPTKAASFLVPANRPMYSARVNPLTQKQEHAMTNLINFTPDFITYAVKDRIQMLEDGESFVVQHDSHYTLVTQRSKTYMLSRNCPANGTLLATSARKPGSSIIFESLSQYSSVEFPCMYHCNITKYTSCEQKSSQSRNVHFTCDGSHKFLSFMTIQNTKKGLILTHSEQNELVHRLSLVNLQNENRVANPKHISNKKNNSLSFFSKDEEPQSVTANQKEYIIIEPQRLQTQFTLKEGQKVIKMINSEFGDSILIITNQNIYGVEFQPKSILTVPINPITKLAKFISQQQPIQDQIVDAAYVIDGLRIIFCTRTGYIAFIDAQNITHAIKIQSVTNKQEDKRIKSLHSMVGRIALETDNKTVILLKMVDKNRVSFEKRFDLPVNFPELQSYHLDVIPKSEELLLQMITKRDSIKLQIQKKSILSPGNQFMDVYSCLYRNASPKDNSAVKISYSISNGIVCILKDHQVVFNRIYEGFSADNNAISQLFAQSFFEKPLGISIDPYGSNVIILFREFVKFFKFQYKKLQQFYTFNVRNVNYASYSPSGQFIIICTEDMLYFVNPFTFQTQNAIQAYGDIKSVFFYETTLYFVLRNKVNKNTQNLMLQVCHERNGQYHKSEQIKIQADEAILTDRRFLIIASKKQIRVYQNQQTDDGQPQKWKNDRKKIQLVTSKKIKLNQYYDYPTCLTLCEQFGILLIGTAFGKIYQYLWPFHIQQQLDNVHVTQCSTTPINHIKFATTFDKMYAFCHNKTLFRFELTQYIEGEQMPNIYTINNKTLYTGQMLKYQFNNRENFYPNHTTYIFDDLHASSEVIEELRFVQEKIKDDLEEHLIKTTAAYEKQLQNIKNQMKKDVNMVKKSIGEAQNTHKQQNGDISETIKVNAQSFSEKIEKYKNQYQKTLLDLYKESARLKKIYADVDRQQTKQRDLFLLQNEETMNQFRKEGEKRQKQYYEKYKDIFEKADNYENFITMEKQEWMNELEDVKKMRHQSVQMDYEEEENRKQNLLGCIGYFSKEINNFKQRKDQFQSLIMETRLQIEELLQDRKQYEQKKVFLEKQLQEKEKLIEEKERQLILYVKNTAQMKTVKNTHQFELTEYETEFEPIIQKIGTVEQNIRKMNGEILKQYSSKVEADKEINEFRAKREKLLEYKKLAIKRKHISQTKYIRFLQEITSILQDPLNPDISSKLNAAAFGDKYEINEQAIRHKEINAKLLRKKDFIRKEIEEHDKREQQIVRNKNQFFRHYNDNTILVREFNQLKQYNKTLQSKMQELQEKLKKIKISSLPAPRTPRKKTNSMLEFKKFSQKKLTPFQRHQQEFHEVFNKGSTTETKLTRSGQSLAFLKTLMKDVQGSDSKYEKMELVRDRVRTYVNPQIRIRKAMNPQRALFEKPKGTFDSIQN